MKYTLNEGNAVEFIETVVFSVASRMFLSDDEFAQLQMTLAVYPDMGVVIPGSGGLRKLRWVSGSKGRRGGLRIIYYWMNAQHQIYLLYVYQKNRKENLTLKEIKSLRKLIEG